MPGDQEASRGDVGSRRIPAHLEIYNCHTEAKMTTRSSCIGNERKCNARWRRRACTLAMYGKGEGKRLQDLRARVATVDDGLAIDSEFLVTLAQRLAVRLLLPKMPILPEAVDVPTAVDDQCATCAKFLPRN